jgi:hypothetical protein
MCEIYIFKERAWKKASAVYFKDLSNIRLESGDNSENDGFPRSKFEPYSNCLLVDPN